ncbi:hypothetical protein [Microbacterium enclense]|uniref:YqaJ-like recombinase domain-containing protein n=1 Tax=Microbacterium enclense TaxID=993073 RepID=A0A1G6NSP5_9MICO|nr:hypothetical protein [Microbacterium enclense]KSU52865.1 hypothetical protein AS029_12715 [Microbacterium enclense]SDC70296.1 hypothetical protein SAMN05216418_2822 [Microbacterium enclense]
MTALAVLERTLGDTADRDSWAHVHEQTIGSYAASSFAKPTSVETYVRQIIAPREFRGNAATESGVRWEPMLLAWAGAEPNTLFVHHPEHRGFGATVDGTIPGDPFAIVETKAKHNRIIDGPTPREVRQMAWQLFCIPEASECRFVWGELVTGPSEDGGWRLRRDPQTLIFPREHPAIVTATALIVPIAHEVLAGVRAARKAESTPF